MYCVYMTCVQAEVVHLKQRLSESRQASVRLEMKLATLKTENAKLLGSQQALNSIREQLSQENSRLSNREREMDGHWQREREKLTNQLNSITAEAQQLKAQLAQQKEELMVNHTASCLSFVRAWLGEFPQCQQHTHTSGSLFEFSIKLIHFPSMCMYMLCIFLCIYQYPRVYTCTVESRSVGRGECLTGAECGVPGEARACGERGLAVDVPT